MVIEVAGVRVDNGIREIFWLRIQRFVQVHQSQVVRRQCFYPFGYFPVRVDPRVINIDHVPVKQRVRKFAFVGLGQPIRLGHVPDDHVHVLGRIGHLVRGILLLEYLYRTIRGHLSIFVD